MQTGKRNVPAMLAYRSVSRSNRARVITWAGYRFAAIALFSVLVGCSSAGNRADRVATERAADRPAASSPRRVGSHSANRVVRSVRQIAADLERQRIMYRQGPDLADCSGIFHRVLRGLKRRNPGIDVPNVQRYRTTRQLARWYHEQGSLRLVSNAAAQDKAIRPGTVLFYGRSNKRYKRFSADDLFRRTGVEHMGIVIDVQFDRRGRVASYGLFHGRSSGKPAKTTRYHRRSHPRYPPYGNGNQQWVAYAPLVPGMN